MVFALEVLDGCMTRITIVQPGKINIEPKKGGLEDGVPFQLGDF